MLPYEELETVLLKIQSVKNGHRFAYLKEDNLGGDALTPSYLMYGRNIRTESNVVYYLRVLCKILVNVTILFKSW